MAAAGGAGAETGSGEEAEMKSNHICVNMDERQVALLRNRLLLTRVLCARAEQAVAEQEQEADALMAAATNALVEVEKGDKGMVHQGTNVGHEEVEEEATDEAQVAGLRRCHELLNELFTLQAEEHSLREHKAQLRWRGLVEGETTQTGVIGTDT